MACRVAAFTAHVDFENILAYQSFLALCWETTYGYPGGPETSVCQTVLPTVS